MAFQVRQDSVITSSIEQLCRRTTQSELEIVKLQNEIELLEAGDYKTYILHKIVEIRQTIQHLNNRKKQLNESNNSLRKEIDNLNKSILRMEKEEQQQQQQQQAEEKKQEINNNGNDNNDNNNDHGYKDKKLSGKCQCEMCRDGIATTHNDDSHDQSLFGKFELDVDNKFKLELVGGSTKCGRVMSNYFGYLEITKKSNIFKNKNCLEVGSGTGIVGCTIAYLGANKVMMTDQPGVIEILSENAKQLNQYNKLYDKTIKIGELLWGENDAKKYINDNQKNGYDILIGSDLIYAHEFIKPLVTTFEILSENKNKITNKHPIVFMSVIRRFKWEENFFNLMKNKFIQYKELEVGDICIYRYIRKEDVKNDNNNNNHNDKQ